MTRLMPGNWRCLVDFGSISSLRSGIASSGRCRQLTTGPLHHFFGYIGHVQNVPWNKSGRYIVALRTPVRDHLPDGSEPAEIVLLDTQNDYSAARGRPVAGLESAAGDDALLESAGAGNAVLLQRPRSR